MLTEPVREQVGLIRDGEAHAHRHHVALRVVDALGEIHLRRIDVEGHAATLDDPAHARIAQERLDNLLLGLAQLLCRP